MKSTITLFIFLFWSIHYNINAMQRNAVLEEEQEQVLYASQQDINTFTQMLVAFKERFTEPSTRLDKLFSASTNSDSKAGKYYSKNSFNSASHEKIREILYLLYNRSKYINTLANDAIAPFLQNLDQRMTTIEQFFHSDMTLTEKIENTDKKINTLEQRLNLLKNAHSRSALAPGLFTHHFCHNTVFSCSFYFRFAIVYLFERKYGNLENQFILHSFFTKADVLDALAFGVWKLGSTRFSLKQFLLNFTYKLACKKIGLGLITFYDKVGVWTNLWNPISEQTKNNKIFRMILYGVAEALVYTSKDLLLLRKQSRSPDSTLQYS